MKKGEEKMPRHHRPRKGAFLINIIALALLFTIIFSTATQAASPVTATEIDELTQLVPAQQEELFAELATERLKYVTSRSLCGKKREWLAFADFYEEYENGAGTGEYVLQRATLQYGLQPLPDSAKTSTLLIGAKPYYIKAEKQSMFTFPTDPVMDLPASAKGDAVKMSASAGKQSVSIALDERYPHKDFEDLQVVLQEMTSSYINYAEKKDGRFDHAVLRLRSYVSDADTLDRAYSWELTLVSEESLPCRGIVIRYDCDTGKVAAAVNREIRSYFGS